MRFGITTGTRQMSAPIYRRRVSGTSPAELRAADYRGSLPELLVSDNGTALTSGAVLRWATGRLEWDYIEPGKPVQNALVEAFNSKPRDECLNEHVFATLAEARAIIEAWRHDYNRVRPHSALGDNAPEQFARAWHSAAAKDGSRVDLREGLS
jgi:putative transposase